MIDEEIDIKDNQKYEGDDDSPDRAEHDAPRKLNGGHPLGTG